jgi:phosphoribulokinase
MSEVKYLPTFQEINQNPKLAGTLDVYVSEANAVTVDGVFSHNKWNSITLTIAKWESYKKTTRICYYKGLQKFKITKKTCYLIPKLIEKVNNNVVPASLYPTHF